MKKDQIVNLLAQNTGLEHKHATQVLDQLLEILSQALTTGMTVSFRNFGTFTTRTRRARRVRDHYRESTRWIDEARVPHFKPSKALKSRVGAKA